MTQPPPQSYETTLAIAKEALRYIGQYRTPPIPMVYELWYRFADGSDRALSDQLRHTMDRDKTVPMSTLENLHGQFCREDTAGDSHQIGRRLVSQMHGLQAALDTQLHAGETLDESLGDANKGLATADLSAAQAAQVIAQLSRRNRAVQQQLEEVKTKLERSLREIDLLREDLEASQKSMMTDPVANQ